jgi:hypothetical protein
MQYPYHGRKESIVIFQMFIIIFQKHPAGIDYKLKVIQDI